jgi:pimeloyl-ACP methyl ester carboxylesterase
MLRFDYSGHGQSEGAFIEGTISQWLGDSIAVLEELAEGPQILVGSSMGGWIALLLLRAIAEEAPIAANLPEIAGAVLIAPAWDMTETLMWGLPERAEAQFEKDGYYDRPSRYGGGPYRITRALIEDGRNHLLRKSKFKPPCPVRILQGIKDLDVPWQHANKLNTILEGENVMLLLVHDGDHRLSRPADIARLYRVVEDLYKSIKEGRG